MHRLVSHVAGAQDAQGFVLRVAADPGALELARILTQSLVRGEDIPGPCREACRSLGVPEALLRDRLWALAALLPDGADEDGPWQVLGVRPGAAPEDIRSAFRKLCLECHPDHHQDDPLAADRFRRIKTAYDMVSKSFDGPAPQVYAAHAWTVPVARPTRPSALIRARRLAPLGLVIVLLIVAVATVDPLIRRLRPVSAPVGTEVPARQAMTVSAAVDVPAHVASPPVAKNERQGGTRTMDGPPSGGRASNDEGFPSEAPSAAGEERMRELLSQAPSSRTVLTEVTFDKDGSSSPVNGERRLRTALSQESQRQEADPETTAAPARNAPDRHVANQAKSDNTADTAEMVPYSRPDLPEPTSARSAAADGPVDSVGRLRTPGRPMDGAEGRPQVLAAAAPAARLHERSEKMGETGFRPSGPDSDEPIPSDTAARARERVEKIRSRTHGPGSEEPISSGSADPVQKRMGKIRSRLPGPGSEEPVSPDTAATDGPAVSAGKLRAPDRDGDGPIGGPRVSGATSARASIRVKDGSGGEAAAGPGTTLKRLDNFLDGYVQEYSRRDLSAFMARFAPGAVENGVPVKERIQQYRESFAAFAVTEYRIEIVQWAMADGDVLLEGRFMLRVVREGRATLFTGTLCMELVSAGSTFLVRSLSYSFL